MFRINQISTTANYALCPLESLRVPASNAPFIHADQMDKQTVASFLVRGGKRFTAVNKRDVQTAGRTFGPIVVALALSSVVAHAQGTVDLSGVTSAMSSVETTAKLAGAIAVIIGIVFGVFQFMGRNITQGFMAIGGGLFAGIVIGFAPQWIASLTGQSVSMVVTYTTKVLG